MLFTHNTRVADKTYIMMILAFTIAPILICNVINNQMSFVSQKWD